MDDKEMDDMPRTVSMSGIITTLKAASQMYAQRERELASSILKTPRARAALFLLLLPVIGLSVAEAGFEGPETLGGTLSYSPMYFTPGIFCLAIAIGLCSGLITGCIGAGGGFIITPALMSIGVKGIIAVGTDLFHIFAKAIMGTIVHRKLGNVNVRLALAMLAGSIAGVSAGGSINRALYSADPALSDLFINIMYVLLLGFLGSYALFDFIRLRMTAGTGAQTNEPSLPMSLQAINLPPMVAFDEDLFDGGKRISAWFVACCGAIVGFIATLLGVAGGFLTFPLYVYVLGVSSLTTVGTDILQIIFTAGYASITQYAAYGFVFYTLAVGMLIGSLLGIQLGAMTTRVVKGTYIRGFYAIAILAGFLNRLFDLPLKMQAMDMLTLSDMTATMLARAGNYAFYGAISIFCIWVLSTLIGRVHMLREV